MLWLPLKISVPASSFKSGLMPITGPEIVSTSKLPLTTISALPAKLKRLPIDCVPLTVTVAVPELLKVSVPLLKV